MARSIRLTTRARGLEESEQTQSGERADRGDEDRQVHPIQGESDEGGHAIEHCLQCRLE